MELTLLNWILALTPVLSVLVLMVGFGWGGSRSGIAAVLIALAIAVFHFGAGFAVIGVALAKSVLLAVDVLYIVWMALLFYNVTNEAGTVRLIGKSLPRLTADRAAQSLLISWIFVSLLQGVGGFGVPVAVVAPLLVGLGYTAPQAVIMSSLGHGWAVTFGSLGTSFVALTAVTGLDGSVFAHESALLLGAASLLSGGLVAFVSTGWQGLLRSLPMLVIVGAAMGITQWLAAVNGIWTLGATSGALVGGVVGVLVVLTPFYRRKTGEPLAEQDKDKSLLLAILAYVILLVLAFSINLIPALGNAFDMIQIKLQFPAVSTAFTWQTPAETGRVISLLGHPGAILLYASILSYVLYARVGYYDDDVLKTIWQKTKGSAVKSTIAILSLVAMAAVMTHAGMTNMIASGISETISQSIYPLVAPFMGALGAFMTGSNTNSNVLFGALQQQTAELLGLSVPLILAGQTAGASLGSVLAPAKVIVGCSTVGLSGEEGPVIRQMIFLGLLPVLFVALAVWGLVSAV